MIIEEVTAKNFRTLENNEIKFQHNFCTLSGKNNAGKTGVVSIIRHFFDEESRRYHVGENIVSYQNDHTQWSKDDLMEVSVRVELDRRNDAEVFFVIDKFAPDPIVGDRVRLRISQKFHSDGAIETNCRANGSDFDPQNSSEVLKKLRSAANLVVHNSTNPNRRLYMISGEMTEVLVSHFTPEDRRKISAAEKNLTNKVKTAAKLHKEELGKLVGRLGENYNVELTALDSGSSSSFPLNIKLNDKSVDVNLTGWGSGTQNRTRVLMSVLEANRMRVVKADENRSTPVVIVEEPESFLHPSAQAEFGKVLGGLADEFGIQIIATTHSPYMLNHDHPEANILLDRKLFRGMLKETIQVDTSGNNWMIPFSENLGIASNDFIPWEKIVLSKSNRVVLVEGEIDVGYFETIKKRFPDIYTLPEDVEIVAYGGKDALKNTALLSFMIGRLDRVFITFDLDAKPSLDNRLTTLGLNETNDFIAVGVSGAGKECIEGLLPDTVFKKVYAENVDDVMALTSADGAARKSAKSNIKRACLEEFKIAEFNKDDLKEFTKLISAIAKAF